MSRVAGSYESVIRGVSQQVPQDRRPGQHYEQVNLISDPVRGLARRHGSQNMDEKRITNQLTGTALAQMLADTAGHKVYSFQVGGKDYDLIYRTKASPGQRDDFWGWCYSKDDHRFIPVSLDRGHPMTAQLLDAGVSAITAVGKYLFIVPNSLNASTSGTDRWEQWRYTMAAWVRAGAYSRTYRLRLQRQGAAEIIVSYTTPASSYPNTLNTSDIPASDPEYVKKVNDRVNAYNSEVTKWIGTAAAAITPQAIAQSLLAALGTALAGIPGVGYSIVDSTIIMSTGSMPNPIIEITCEDGGDGSTFRAVGAEVASADLVSTIHFPGKVIRVRPKKNDGSDVFYLKAYPKQVGATDWGEVTWREAAGYESTPFNLWCMGLVTTFGGQEILAIGGDAANLSAKVGGTHPTYSTSGSGDRTSNPVPAFIGRQISYLGLFQDRLVVGAGAVLMFSKTGDYQNFFRTSVLTLDDDDPVEMFALGAEDDTIRAATTYDRNMLIFGKRKQYVVSGRQPLTPRNASIVVQSSHEDAVDSFPINSGNFVFYNKYRNGVSSAHQVQIGQLADTPESYEISKQLDRYIKGRPQELVAVTAPNMLFMRTDAMRNSFYVYTYLDSAAGSERLFDSWSLWRTQEQCGALVGISRHEGDLLGYYVRLGQSATEGSPKMYIAADKFVLDTDLSDQPYLDSWRPYLTTRTKDETTLSPNNANFYNLDAAGVAFDNTVPEYMLGTTYTRIFDLESQYPDKTGAMIAGWNMEAFVTPTNPYILDSNNKAIVTGRLTLTKVTVSVADTGGMRGRIDGKFGTTYPTEYTGRSVGSPSNVIGRAPISTTAVSVPLGREVRDFTYTLLARGWLPLTITAIEWTGQFFNNTRRA